MINKNSLDDIQELRGQILKWYDTHGRELPWRYKNGAKPDPYKVWLSEIMCQQTTVQAVKPYYTKFLTLWPTIENLANAPQEDVMKEWAGLGYYARARNLHKCAQIIANDMAGTFPNNQTDLKKLPGVGDYTSAAIASIAFNEPATVMDGNIERIIARLFALHDPLPKSKPIFKEKTALLFEDFNDRPGDLAQALMDIGTSICTPKNPRCILCPIQNTCEAYKQGIQDELPVKIKLKNRPRKYGEAYWIENTKGEILFHKRPEKGLLGGMIGLPTTSWETNIKNIKTEKSLQAYKFHNFKSQAIHHTFTHFDLKLTLKTASFGKDTSLPDGYLWANPHDMGKSLPTVFKKAFNLFNS